MRGLRLDARVGQVLLRAFLQRAAGRVGGRALLVREKRSLSAEGGALVRLAVHLAGLAHQFVG
ncbi:MAG: hypothetical protein BRD29_03270, partial [Bacteroidetes bacterium QH_2_67_10]